MLGRPESLLQRTAEGKIEIPAPLRRSVGQRLFGHGFLG